MPKADLYSRRADGTTTDEWIWDELLGADDLPDPHRVDLATLEAVRDAAEWNEDDHPRDEAGRFAPGGSFGKSAETLFKRGGRLKIPGSVEATMKELRTRVEAEGFEFVREGGGVLSFERGSDKAYVFSSEDHAIVDVSIDGKSGDKEALAKVVARDFVRTGDAVYHGTTSEALESILSDGLIPSGGEGADAATRYKIGSNRKAAVFITASLKDAEYFGALAAKASGGDPIVLEIRIPKSAASKVKPDHEMGGIALRVESRIPSSWIRRVKAGGSWRQLEADPGDEVVYACLVVGVADGARNAAEWNEEDHPRDDSGRFAPKGSAPTERQKTIAKIGMRKPTPEEKAAEEERQYTLADAASSPLAFPVAVLGIPPMGPRDHEVMRYVAAYGREFEGKAKRPSRAEMGEPNECYMNASQLVIQRDDLDYAEGFCYPTGSGLAVLHGWCVTKDGQVIDPTPTVDPSKARYFGVVYERKPYMRSLFKQKFYGMLGADYKTADLVVATGAKGIRKEQ